MRNNNKIQFFVVEQGVNMSDLEQRAEMYNLNKVPVQRSGSPRRFVWLMAMADARLVVERKCVADLVLPSELTSIFLPEGTCLLLQRKMLNWVTGRKLSRDCRTGRGRESR